MAVDGLSGSLVPCYRTHSIRCQTPAVWLNRFAVRSDCRYCNRCPTDPVQWCTVDQTAPWLWLQEEPRARLFRSVFACFLLSRLKFRPTFKLVVSHWHCPLPTLLFFCLASAPFALPPNFCAASSAQTG